MPVRHERSAKKLDQVAPQGTLIHLDPSRLRPSPENPRKLFDRAPLDSLKASIREHGVLVPLTVYKLAGQDRYGILDGERRYKVCVELASEGVQVAIPANVVDPPDAMASIIYMFNIHQFREQWELMPTARALKQVIGTLGHSDPAELRQITGLSLPQIDRCLRILSFPEHFQQLSLAEDPIERVPSNFWVEFYPVLDVIEKRVPDLIATEGRDGITQKVVAKYRAGRIKSVLHFRRVLEAFDVVENEAEKRELANRLREYILDVRLETRKAFDEFIADPRRMNRASEAADRFMREVRRAQVDHAVDGKEELLAKLHELLEFVQRLISELEGSDPPLSFELEEGEE